MNRAPDRLLLVADLTGTFLFGLEGAQAAIAGNLDLLGILVLAFATALAGGVTRDVLIGDLPPASLRDWRYPATAFFAGTLVFFLHPAMRVIPTPFLVGLDAAALSLFAVAGTQKALDFGINPFIAVLLGTITGVGGGTIRDIFLAQIPAVLRADIYATAALFGSIIMVLARKLGAPAILAALLGGVACFLLRIVAVWQHWNLPKVT
jgi:uncharacterized membrane protein YeiH